MAVAITGIGLTTALGNVPSELLARIARGEKGFRRAAYLPGETCPCYAEVSDFNPEKYFPENKTLRLMGRDAQLAVVAARLAMQDAKIVPGELYPAEYIALYGATGLSGMPTGEIARLVCDAAAEDGSLDLEKFGRTALKRTRPVLSFKILANMPICFVSIFENIRGPNAVYSPWEGNGAQAIAAGIEAVESGDAPCALVGGCDVKIHSLSIASLHQLGVLKSWQTHRAGSIPGEGAAFLVLENHQEAIRRGGHIYGRINNYALKSTVNKCPLAESMATLLQSLDLGAVRAIVAAGDGDPSFFSAEKDALDELGLGKINTIYPKNHIGNLFAAAAAVQVVLAARMAADCIGSAPVLANCFGFGTELASFMLEAA